MKEVIRKVYVEVAAVFLADGFLFPTEIIWEDGRHFQIDKVKSCVRAASLKAGGAGLRFTCLIAGTEHYLFYEENYRWFVEGKSYVEA